MAKSTHTADYRRFLKRLQAARASAGLTQTEVAKRLGQPQSYVSKCENGERRVDVVELVAFARIYRQPLAYFVPGAGDAG